MIKQAIANYINAKAERFRPCSHEWELLTKVTNSPKLNPSYEWYEWIYRCKKCCEGRKVSSND